jgi:hypothetical protein
MVNNFFSFYSAKATGYSANKVSILLFRGSLFAEKALIITVKTPAKYLSDLQ